MAGVWNATDDDDFADCEYWTVLLMIPASFFDVSKPQLKPRQTRVRGGDSAFLMEPLQTILPTLASILFEIISRILKEWTEISDYIETFIASENAFLKEEKHDDLLFDDDTFSRSRQYFWVITSIGEFLPIIDSTIEEWHRVSGLVVRSAQMDERSLLDSRLEDIKERLKSQRKRSVALRDGVSPSRRMKNGLVIDSPASYLTPALSSRVAFQQG